ncbi:MAG: hypothetical protein F6K32_11835 [Desertifilum sp. SIO1I2]|nr:hypothetical protein [Desertifilum sp. SIO1I2]
MLRDAPEAASGWLRSPLTASFSKRFLKGCQEICSFNVEFTSARDGKTEKQGGCLLGRDRDRLTWFAKALTNLPKRSRQSGD